MKNFLVSVVVPVFNEQESLEEFIKHLLPALTEFPYEVIFIDDGSHDQSVHILKKHIAKDKHIKLISFYRNFGHQIALMAGYQAAKGDCVVTIDADLQDPPEVIPQLIEKWHKGAKVVYAKRAQRQGESAFKLWTAQAFYKLINMLSDSPIPTQVGDFRLLDREVVNFLNGLTEQQKFLRGLVAWSGYPAAVVTFERHERFAGKTHYTLSRMLNFALEGITSFSTKPLRLATFLGFFTSFFSIVVIVYKLIERALVPNTPWQPGWASLFFAIVFLGGVQLITLGLLGEYISRIYSQVQHRPEYLVKEKVNLE